MSINFKKKKRKKKKRKDKYKEQKLQTAVCCFPNNTSRFSFYQGHCR